MILVLFGDQCLRHSDGVPQRKERTKLSTERARQPAQLQVRIKAEAMASVTGLERTGEDEGEDLVTDLERGCHPCKVHGLQEKLS